MKCEDGTEYGFKKLLTTMPLDITLKVWLGSLDVLMWRGMAGQERLSLVLEESLEVLNFNVEKTKVLGISMFTDT